MTAVIAPPPAANAAVQGWVACPAAAVALHPEGRTHGKEGPARCCCCCCWLLGDSAGEPHCRMRGDWRPCTEACLDRPSGSGSGSDPANGDEGPGLLAGCRPGVVLPAAPAAAGNAAVPVLRRALKLRGVSCAAAPGRGEEAGLPSPSSSLADTQQPPVAPRPSLRGVRQACASPVLRKELPSSMLAAGPRGELKLLERLPTSRWWRAVLLPS